MKKVKEIFGRKTVNNQQTDLKSLVDTAYDLRTKDPAAYYAALLQVMQAQKQQKNKNG